MKTPLPTCMQSALIQPNDMLKSIKLINSCMRTCLSIWDVVVETGLCKDVGTAVNSLLFGQDQSQLFI